MTRAARGVGVIPPPQEICVFLSQILHFTHIFESEATPINLASTEPPVDRWMYHMSCSCMEASVEPSPIIHTCMNLLSVITSKESDYLDSSCYLEEPLTIWYSANYVFFL
jgi:hypothetical protein